MATTPAPLLLSVDDACAMIGVGRSLLYRLGRQGEIAMTTIGRRRVVSVASLRRFAKRRLRDAVPSVGVGLRAPAK